MLKNLESRGIKIPLVQFLPNNLYIFLFKESIYVQQVLSQGIWLLWICLMIFHPWTKGFKSRKGKPFSVPIWVDFLDLPLQFFPWMKDIGSQLGKVKGHKPIPNINPKLKPQLLEEFDTLKTLK